MTIEEFCTLHPRLYHMATAGSLSQIEKHGLLSTNAILDLLALPQDRREKLCSERRPEMTPLQHIKHGKFILRDQKPLRDNELKKCLDGMTVSDWYRSLNSRVFMWANRDRVDRLLNARAYKADDQLVLTIDSKPLLEKHFDKIAVSTINSGATLFRPVRRGLQTFVSLRNYPIGRGVKAIAEVTVPYAIPEMRDYILKSETRKVK